MKDKITRLAMLFILLISATSCSIVKGVFEAGMGVGIFLVVVVLIVIGYVFFKITGKK